jgi:hypothetical protein
VSVKKGEAASTSIAGILNAKNNSPEYGNAIVYDGMLYMYLPKNHENGETGYGWYCVYKRGDSADEKRIDDILTAYK